MKKPSRKRREYSSPVREAAARKTRSSILEAFARQLGRPGATDFSVAEAARTAGVSVRTVHHYFPDRRACVQALAAWAEDAFGPLAAPLETPGDLPAFVRAAYERAGRNIDLTRAMYVTGLGNEVRLARLKARRAKIQEILAALGADPAETRRAAAVVAMLASSEAGVPLMDIHGLDLATAGEAAAEAVEAIVTRLTAAGRCGRVKKS
ncbi:MAG: hypothetical protein GMKNLPBB_03084 [Myxococcota bacterium]|nr:hypothetical protein [Myxococcota bacterium]